jgi:hypothetical protein
MNFQTGQITDGQILTPKTGIGQIPHFKVKYRISMRHILLNTKRHQNPEFGPKPGEIKNKYVSLKGGLKLRNSPLFVPN